MRDGATSDNLELLIPMLEVELSQRSQDESVRKHVSEDRHWTHEAEARRWETTQEWGTIQQKGQGWMANVQEDADDGWDETWNQGWEEPEDDEGSQGWGWEDGAEAAVVGKAQKGRKGKGKGKGKGPQKDGSKVGKGKTNKGQGKGSPGAGGKGKKPAAGGTKGKSSDNPATRKGASPQTRATPSVTCARYLAGDCSHGNACKDYHPKLPDRCFRCGAEIHRAGQCPRKRVNTGTAREAQAAVAEIGGTTSGVCRLRVLCRSTGKCRGTLPVRLRRHTRSPTAGMVGRT